MLSIIKDFTFKIHLNPYGENAEYIIYLAEGLNTGDLIAEIPTFKSFVTDGTVPTRSKCKKEGENRTMSKENIDELLAGYDEDPEGSKPK
jgi:hypothetical protein